MRRIIRIIFSLIVSTVMCGLGFPYYTWQFWAIGVPILILYRILEEAFYPQKR